LTVALGSAGTGPSTASPFSTLQPLSPIYNSDQDGDWQANFEDFNYGQGSGMNFSQESSDDSFEEDPLVELGIYNRDEDRSGWPFKQKFTDLEWQETEMTLLQDTENFTRPQPGPTAPPLARVVQRPDVRQTRMRRTSKTPHRCPADSMPSAIADCRVESPSAGVRPLRTFVRTRADIRMHPGNVFRT
jgi:hypothetical protein